MGLILGKKRASTAMAKWQRIPDDDTAHFGNADFEFVFHNGCYDVFVDQSNQDRLTVRCLGKAENWHIETKEKRMEGEFRLSGLAYAMPEIQLNDVYWFELYISQSPKIVFWGDRVIFRTDLCRDP